MIGLFKLFWAFCTLHGTSATSASVCQLAGMILQFAKVVPSHARHAYASLLLIPGMESLQFSPLLRQIKRSWNATQTRYVHFYDAPDPIARLASTPFNSHSVEELRLRLLLCLRFFMLCRNIDLERIFRTVSFINERPFILIKRKGQLKPQWEQVVTIPGCDTLCPWKLLQKYVALTATQALPGTPLFITLKPPFKPLKANSIGSLTRHALKKTRNKHLGLETPFHKGGWCHNVQAIGFFW